MQVSDVRFIKVPLTCIHGMLWGASCQDCEWLRDRLNQEGPNCIPRDTMAVGVLVTLNASEPICLPAERKVLTDGN